MKQSLALIISIGFGLLAVFAMKNYMERERSVGLKKENLVEVLFSKRHLDAKSVLQRSDVQVKALPSSAVSPDMVKPHEVIEIEGQAILREINRGGPFFHSDFLGSQGRSMSEVNVGRRLISVSVSLVTGVSGLVKPGHRVDLFYTHSAAERQKSSSGLETILLLENVSVHAIDAQTVNVPSRRDRRQYSTLTLSVTPQEAALLTQAGRGGVITFAIRAKEDFERFGAALRVDDENLMDLARASNAARWGGVEVPN